jgi:hypothetical protein
LLKTSLSVGLWCSTLLKMFVTMTEPRPKASG